MSRNIFEFTVPFAALAVRESDILAILGYSADKAPQHFQAILKGVLAQAKTLCHARVGYRLFSDVKFSGDRRHLDMGGVSFAVGRIIAAQLRRAEGAALFVCTIGSEMEQWAAQRMNGGDYIQGYIADAVASALVEAAADKIHNHLEQKHPGIRTSNRYSPGYCGWDVAEQQKLFSLLPMSFCGVSLSASSLMSPIKSVSGVIGLGPHVQRSDYPCRLCDMNDCLYRRRFENSMQE